MCFKFSKFLRPPIHNNLWPSSIHGLPACLASPHACLVDVLYGVPHARFSPLVCWVWKHYILGHGRLGPFSYGSRKFHSQVCWDLGHLRHPGTATAERKGLLKLVRFLSCLYFAFVILISVFRSECDGRDSLSKAIHPKSGKEKQSTPAKRTRHLFKEQLYFSYVRGYLLVQANLGNRPNQAI